MKRLLVDLSILRHPYCGLGQIALNYGHWYAQHVHELPKEIEVTLLVPKSYMGAFGQDVKYLEAKECYRWLPWLMPRQDIWQSIHQLSPFRPSRVTTHRILTVHDVNFMYEKQGRKRERYRRHLQSECDEADTIIFISHFVEEDVRRHIALDGKKTYVIYNGVENLQEGTQRQPSAVDNSTPFLLNIGVVKPKKNNHVLPPMMDLLPEYRLIITGNDNDPYARKIRNSLSRHPNVQMLGTVDNEERRWLYAHSVGLVMPSLSEGFGLPIIEAMQWGKPVFASHMTSLPEIGDKYAFYFTSFDAESMAQTIRDGLTVADDNLAKAEQQYAATFNYSSHMKEYWEIISQISCLYDK